MKRWAVNRKLALVIPLTLLCLAPVGCEHRCDSCGYEEPDAPYGLDTELFNSGIHLTWQDASDNEELFIVERAARSSAALRQVRSLDLSAMPVPPSEAQAFGHHFIELVRLPEDTEDYLDTDVYRGMTYFYRVKAVNDAGSSTSDEIEVTFP